MTAARTPTLSAEELRRLIDYNPDTGTFIWKVWHGGHHGQIPPGGVAGSIYPDGYRIISIGNVRYKAARLAFVWMTGRWPHSDIEIDHINRNHSDDRWSNLREATPQQSQANKIMKNASGFKGVCYEPSRRKYKAYIEVNGRSMHLGRFKTAEEAHAAYEAAARKYFGEFALAKGEYKEYK